MIAFLLLCYFCVNFMQISAAPAPQLVFPDQNLCEFYPTPVSVVPIIIDPNVDYVDSINHPVVYDVGPQPVPYIWPTQGISSTISSTQIDLWPDYYYDNTFYDPVEDVVRDSLSKLAEISVNAEDFADCENDFLDRFTNPYIV